MTAQEYLNQLSDIDNKFKSRQYNTAETPKKALLECIEENNRLEVRNKIIADIFKLTNTNYIAIIYARYIKHIPLEKIARIAGTSFEYINRLHNEALREIEKKADI